MIDSLGIESIFFIKQIPEFSEGLLPVSLLWQPGFSQKTETIVFILKR